jgi:hypothetical protein
LGFSWDYLLLPKGDNIKLQIIKTGMTSSLAVMDAENRLLRQIISGYSLSFERLTIQSMPQKINKTSPTGINRATMQSTPVKAESCP